jgi:hypothetical protein
MKNNTTLKKQTMWIFAEYKTERDYPLKPYSIKFFSDHTELKEFSNKQAKQSKSLYPGYISMYWDVEILTTVEEKERVKGTFEPTNPKKYSQAKKYMVGGAVWHCFDLSSSRGRRELALYRTICKNCGRPYGEHSGTDGNKCPAGE